MRAAGKTSTPTAGDGVNDDTVEDTDTDSETARPRGLRPWLWVVGISVLSAFAVPYLILPLIDYPLATYLFWSGFSLVIAIFVIWGVARWTDR